jgi:glucokinase
MQADNSIMSDFSIGLDLGGTNLRAAAIDRSGKLLDHVVGKTGYSAGREEIVRDIVDAIETLRQRRGAAGLAGIGVAVPGFISIQEGVIRNANNLTSLENFPIRDELSKRLGTPVILENDANAAALGEKWIGAGRTVDDLVLITLGTGIGGGIISGGKIMRGSVGMAGELGHITVVPNGNPCGCGNRGCLEKHASATAVMVMARLMGLGDGMSAQDVYDLAKSGNEKAGAIFVAAGEALGIALAMLVNTFNYPLYLIAGGPTAAWDLLAPPMLEETRRRSFTYRATKTRIEKAELGNEAGLFGAAYLSFDAVDSFVNRP